MLLTVLSCLVQVWYLGKTQPNDQVDVWSDATAVIRNLRAGIGTETSATASTGMRLVVTDRYHMSVALSMWMLAMGIYSVGAVMTPARLVQEHRQQEEEAAQQHRPWGIPGSGGTGAPRLTLLCWWATVLYTSCERTGACRWIVSLAGI